MGHLFSRRAADQRKPFKDMAADTHMADKQLADDIIIPAMETDLEVHPQKEHAQKGHAQSETLPPPRSKIFTFMGASGGVGVTSLALQTAYELASRSRTDRGYSRHNQVADVCLIDLDFEGGAAAYHMDVVPRVAIDDLRTNAERIDQTLTATLLSPHACGVNLLAAENMPDINAQSINPQAVMALLDAACALHSYVIIDMPRYQQSWSDAVIGGSDFVGIVAELTISSLHMSRGILNRAETMIVPPPNCHPIINKYERRSFNNTLRLKDAENVLGREVMSTICIDTDTCREAINCGQPIGAVRPDNRYVKDTRKLIKNILKSCEPQSNISDMREGQIQAA